MYTFFLLSSQKGVMAVGLAVLDLFLVGLFLVGLLVGFFLEDLKKFDTWPFNEELENV
jgi:hypothetical protein